MKNVQLLSLALLGCLSWGIAMVWEPTSEMYVDPPILTNSPTPADIEFATETRSHYVLHTLRIPADSGFVVTPTVSSNLQTVEQFAQETKAIAVLNGGFFDPVNQKTTSYIVQQGELTADPQLNERLIENPNNAPYLDQILNRSEFRRLACGEQIEYAIALHRQPPPPGCQVVDALGAGPRLLPEMGLQAEGFLDRQNNQTIRDALGSQQPNARTAIGITRDRTLLWVMVAQKPNSETPSGISLIDMGQLMRSLGAETALNLDGGSSASLYYQGQTYYGRINTEGEWVKRPVKSVLLLQKPPTAQR